LFALARNARRNAALPARNNLERRKKNPIREPRPSRIGRKKLREISMNNLIECLPLVTFILITIWSLGIILWANRLAARHRQLRLAFNTARQTADIRTALVLSRAMREIRKDLCYRWYALNPIHWIRTLARDYTARAAWGIDQW
jgi:hypothetical protein